MAGEAIQSSVFYHQFTVGFVWVLFGFHFNWGEKKEVFLMGSVLLPLAKHSFKKASSSITFILSSRQALHQYLTLSP